MIIERQSVVIVLEDAANRIALQLRDDKPHITDPNQWGLFGGWMENDENPHDAGLREVYEELAVRLQPSKLELVGIQIMHPHSQTFVMRYPVNDELENAILHEGQDWRFMSRAEILRSAIAPRHLAVLQWYWEHHRP